MKCGVLWGNLLKTRSGVEIRIDEEAKKKVSISRLSDQSIKGCIIYTYILERF